MGTSWGVGQEMSKRDKQMVTERERNRVSANASGQDWPQLKLPRCCCAPLHPTPIHYTRSCQLVEFGALSDKRWEPGTFWACHLSRHQRQYIYIYIYIYTACTIQFLDKYILCGRMHLLGQERSGLIPLVSNVFFCFFWTLMLTSSKKTWSQEVNLFISLYK